jgi:hypothetical protein
MDRETQKTFGDMLAGFLIGVIVTETIHMLIRHFV